MPDTLQERFRKLKSTAPFWALRFVEETRELFAVRQDTPEPPSLSTDRGAMLTAVCAGGYGYCATSDVSSAGLQAALDRASAWAESTRAISVYAYDPARMPASRGERWMESGTARPAAGSALYDLLAGICRDARTDQRIVERYAALALRTLEQVYLTNTGGAISQRLHSIIPHAHVTTNAGTDTQTRSFLRAQQDGLDAIERCGFGRCGERLAQEAVQLLLAPNCPSGRMPVLLMPDQMMLQIHESIGHPLELDRILGDERNYAGTSFVTLDMFGRYQYGSALLNVTFDPSLPGELAGYAFDDEGTPAEKVWLIRNGMLQRPLGGYLSQLRAGLPGTANARASGWNRPPIDRMANLNIEPGESTLADMIGAIERGVLMRTNVSWSIDDSRNKFQFGCEWGELIEDGALKGVVKNPNYRGVSATFWRSLSSVGNSETFEVHGTLYCGKGEPNQAIDVGHAAPACVFRDVEVFGGAEGPVLSG
ncbi:MAG TPA: TldD/PmbA family protein, partial [Burkholderiales bacterium]|nr:TldD/PmbA family protein [Burkholderiales bacterium]